MFPILGAMIKRLHVEGFTKFERADFRFTKGLNVFVGVNGSGKSHVLKLLYANMRAMTPRKEYPASPGKVFLNSVISERLVRIFRPDGLKLGRLATRKQGTQKSVVDMEFVGGKLRYTFSTRSQNEVRVESAPPRWQDKEKPPVFLPTREMLSIYPGFTYIYDNYEIPFEETWRDLAELLSAPRPRGPRLEVIKDILSPLGQALGGEILLDGDAFYVRSARGKLEAHLLAAGLRKIGTITHLIVNGTLARQSCLFWDEPEANLNPRLLISVAETIAHLVEQGIQVFIATHSLFLLRQLQLLSLKNERLAGRSRYFGFGAGEGEGASSVECAESIDKLRELASLHYQIEQDALVLEECYGYEC